MIVRTYYCDRCKEEVEKESLTEIIRHGGGYLHLCPSCDKELDKLISQEKPKRKQTNKDPAKPKRKYTRRTDPGLQITMSDEYDTDCEDVRAVAEELAQMG